MKINKIKCDQCGWERDLNAYGGFEKDWQKYNESNSNIPLDFCSTKCLIEYITKEKK